MTTRTAHDPARKRPTNPGDTMSTQQPETSTDDQPTLANYGTGTTAEPTADSSRPDELETPDAPAQTKLAGEWTDDDLAYLYREGLFPQEIAAEIDADCTGEEVAVRLRRADVLEAQDDPVRLEYLYCECGWSTTKIAETACDGDVSGETIASRLHRFGLVDATPSGLLEALDPEDLDLSPSEVEPDPRFTRRTGGRA